MRKVAILVTVLSAGMWAASVWNVFSRAMPGLGGSVLRAAAATTAIMATVLWTARGTRRQHAGSLGLMARTVAKTTRHDARDGLSMVQEAGSDSPPGGSQRPRR